jgi:hypothetical protein
MSSVGAAPRAAVPVSDARAEASRKNGAPSRGPRTLEGNARWARSRPCSGGPSRSRPGVWRADGLAAGTRLGPVAGRKGVGVPFPNQSGDAQPSGQQAELFEERRIAQGGLGLRFATATARVVRDGWPEPAPTSVVGALRPTLSWRGNDRVLARAARPQGAPGCRPRCRAARSRHAAPRQPGAPTERTRAPTRIRFARPAHVRSRDTRIPGARISLSRIERTRQPRQYWRISSTRRAREPKRWAARSHPNFIDVVAAHIRRTRQGVPRTGSTTASARACLARFDDTSPSA